MSILHGRLGESGGISLGSSERRAMGVLLLRTDEESRGAFLLAWERDGDLGLVQRLRRPQQQQQFHQLHRLPTEISRQQDESLSLLEMLSRRSAGGRVRESDVGDAASRFGWSHFLAEPDYSFSMFVSYAGKWFCPKNKWCRCHWCCTMKFDRLCPLMTEINDRNKHLCVECLSAVARNVENTGKNKGLPICINCARLKWKLEMEAQEILDVLLGEKRDKLNFANVCYFRTIMSSKEKVQ